MAVTQVTAAALCERVFFLGLRIKGHGGDRLAQGSFTLTCFLGQKLGPCLPPRQPTLRSNGCCSHPHRHPSQGA